MKWYQWILDCIYPRRCPVCDQVLPPGGTMVCPGCLEKLQVREGFHCKKCGKFILQEEKEFCDDCLHTRHSFEEGYGIFPYSGWAQRSMVRFKFHGRTEYGAFYGKMMAYAAQRTLTRWDPQVILPVPMYRKKEKKRGYNQAAILARETGKCLHIPVRGDLVRRIRDTKPQKDMTLQMRRKNLKGAFAVSPEAAGYERILLIDDIYTTGSTVDAIAKILKQRGAEKIYFLTACTGIGF